jgi:hypothetical protein
MMPNLPEELRCAAAHVRQRHIDRLVGLVGAEALAEACHSDTHIAVAEIEECDGCYVPSEGGPLAFITPVRIAGDLVDLAAWRPMQPNRWLLRTGSGWCLGEQAILGDWQGALTLQATPLDWLRSGCEGVVVLDWSSSEVRQLANLQTVRVSDPAVGRMLLDTLSRPARLPSIEPMEVARAA